MSIDTNMIIGTASSCSQGGQEVLGERSHHVQDFRRGDAQVLWHLQVRACRKRRPVPRTRTERSPDAHAT